MAFAEGNSLLTADRSFQKSLDMPSSSSDDWSSTYSSDSSDSKSCSESGYNPDWESYVNKHGNLFYVEYITEAVASSSPSAPVAEKQYFPSLRNSLSLSTGRRNRKTTDSHLGRLIGRQERKTRDVRPKPSGNFNEFADGEMREVTIFIDPATRVKFDRRATLAESILGLSTSPFPHSKRIMVSAIGSSSELSIDRHIRSGDWLRAINGQEITGDNFDHVLLSFNQPTTIRLQLKRFHATDQATQPNVVRVTNTGDFVAALRDLVPVMVEDKLMSGHSTAFTVMYLSTNDTIEAIYDGSEVLFCYPPKEVNCLYAMRGMFLTLNSLFREPTFGSKPTTTTITVKDTEYYVSYYSVDNGMSAIYCIFSFV